MKRKNDDLYGEDKPKRGDRPKRKRRRRGLGRMQRTLLALLALFMISIGGVLLFYGLLNSDDEAVEPAETLTIPFDKLEPTFTELAYSGTVQIEISGYGQAGGEDYSDAFYLYAHGDGTPYLPPMLENFDLEIDGQRAIYTLDLLDDPPAYNSAHRYHVQYDVGDIPRQIAFRISDSIVDDNNGQFTVAVYAPADQGK